MGTQVDRLPVIFLPLRRANGRIPCIPYKTQRPGRVNCKNLDTASTRIGYIQVLAADGNTGRFDELRADSRRRDDGAKTGFVYETFVCSMELRL